MTENTAAEEDLKVVAFRFAPADYVTVIHLGMNHKGRVGRCIWTSGGRQAFEVEFNQDGELKYREFYSDELEPRNP